MPLTLTSLISGREIFPSVRTTTVCESSGSFQTLMCSTSDSPTTYPGGTTTAGGAFSAVLSTALSAGFATSAALGLSAVSDGFRLAVCVCAYKPVTRNPQNIAAVAIIFLQESIL